MLNACCVIMKSWVQFPPGASRIFCLLLFLISRVSLKSTRRKFTVWKKCPKCPKTGAFCAAWGKIGSNEVFKALNN